MSWVVMWRCIPGRLCESWEGLMGRLESDMVSDEERIKEM